MLRSSTSHAVLALAAAALLSTTAWADVDSGQTVKISSISGDTTLAGGTLQLDSGSPFSRAFTFKDSTSSTIDAYGKSSVLSGKLSGKGNITFADSVGGGTVTLTNSNNAFTGTTTVNSGVTLALVDSDTNSDSNGTSGTIATSQRLINNGIFDVSGAVNSIGLVSLSGSGTVKLGSNSLTLNDYNSTDSTTYDTNTTYSGVITGTGSLILSSGEITLTGINTFTGSVTVSSDTLHIAGSGSIASASSVLVYGTLDYAGATGAATITSLSGSGTVTLGANDLVLTAASGAFTGTITTTGKLVLNGGTQYIGGASNALGGVVINAGTLELGGSNADIAIGYNIANSDTLALYSTYGVTVNGVISGTGALDKWGSGIATIASVQSYTGATVVTGGTLKLTGAGSIASSSGVQVDSIFDLTESSGATIQSLTGLGAVRLGAQSLTITGVSSTTDFSGSITGTGALTISGGSQSLSGTSTYTGDTKVTGGKLILVAGASLKSAVTLQGGNLVLSKSVTSSGNVTINSLISANPLSTVTLDANTLILASASNGVFAGTISGTGGLTISGGTETLSGSNTYTGTTTVASGAKLILTGNLAAGSKLNISGALDASGVATPALTVVSLAGSGTVALGAHGLVLNTAENTSTAFSGVISGSAGLTVGGKGTQVLSGTNTYTGGTTVNADATLQIGNGSSSGSIQGNIVDNGTVRFYRLDTSTFTGVISGTGAVVQGGIGTTILTGANTYTGGTTITAGTLQIGDGTSASGSITGDITDNGTLAFARTGATTIDARVSGAGNLTIKNGTIALTGVSTYTGSTSIASGAELDLVGTGSIADTSRVTADGTFDISGTAAGASIVSLAGAGTVKLGGQTLTVSYAANDTFAGTLSGTGGFVVAGGNQTLKGTSTGFTGATTVTGGTLAVTGSIANSAVTVKNGGMVSGTGTIGGLTVENGGTVKAGANGVGTLTVNGALDLKTGGIYAVDVTSAGAAKLAVTGTAGLHGKLAITSSDGTYDLGNKVTVLTSTGAIDYTGFTADETFTGTNKAVFKTTLDKSNANALGLTINLYQLSPALKAAGTPGANQTSVVAGIDKAIAAGTQLSAAFQSLGNDTGAELLSDSHQLTGEIGADASQAVRAAFSPFLDAMSQRTAMLRPLGKSEARPFETWVSAYGGTSVVAADEDLGTHKFHSNVAGAIAGAQWSPWPNMVLGGAVGVGTSDFHIDADLGKGKATSIDAGVYGYLQASRHLYSSFAAAVSATQVKTTRVLTVSGSDTLTGKATAFSFGGRYEAGIQLSLFTPYVAVQDHLTMLPSYTEGAATGSNATYALSYESRTVNSGRAEIGLRHFIDVDVTPRWILTPDFTLHLNDRLAYAYDLSDGTKAGVQFADLKASDFNVFGAKQGRHAGIASVGADILFTNGLRLTTTAEAAVSQKSESFTGFVTLGYTW